MSTRTLADVQDDIDRCQWLRKHMPNLGDVLKQDRTLARLTAERDALTNQQPARRSS